MTFSAQLLDFSSSQLWDAQLKTFEILARGYATANNNVSVGFSNPSNKRVFLFIRPTSGDYTQTMAPWRADSPWGGATGGRPNSFVRRTSFVVWGVNTHSTSDGDYWPNFTFEYLIVTPEPSPVTASGYGIEVMTADGSSVLSSNKNYLVCDFCIPQFNSNTYGGTPQTYLFPETPASATRFVSANSIVVHQVTDGWLGEFRERAVACWIKSATEIVIKAATRYLYSNDAENGYGDWQNYTNTGGTPFISGYVVD